MDPRIPKGNNSFTASGVTVGDNSKFHQGNTYIFHGGSHGRSFEECFPSFTSSLTAQTDKDELELEILTGNLFDIFIDIFCLDLLLLELVRQATSRGDTDLFGGQDRDYIVSHFRKCRLPKASYESAYYGHIAQEQKIRQILSQEYNFLESRYLDSRDLVPYYTRLYEHCLTNSNTATGHVGDTRRVLRLLYEIPLRARKHIQQLMEVGQGVWVLETLKPRMEAFQEHFPEVCRELKKPEQRLVGTDSAWWQTPTEPARELVSSPSQFSRGGAQVGSQTYDMPSNSTVSSLNGPQLNSSVFNGPVHFGNVYRSSQTDQNTGR